MVHEAHVFDHRRSVAAIRFLEEGSHNVKMKPLIVGRTGPKDGDARADHRPSAGTREAPHEVIINPS